MHDPEPLGTPGAFAAPAAELRGLPSAVWRFGQDRRFELLRRLVDVTGGASLDLGCGLGVYTARMADAGATALGTEVEWPRAVEARQRGVDVVAAVGERLPFGDGRFRTVLIHEVLEHVADDAATVAEAVRVLEPGGRVIIFVPNRGPSRRTASSGAAATSSATCRC